MKRHKSYNFIQCIRLLDLCFKYDVLFKDTNNTDNMFIYRQTGNPPEENPEGWYSENILTVASELTKDVKGQKALLRALKKKTKLSDDILKNLNNRNTF